MRRHALFVGLALASTALVAPARAHFLGCNSTDAGEIRYGGSTQWSDAKNHGISAWNTLGSIDIEPDTWTTWEDLTWSDVHYSDVAWVGQFTCYGGGTADTIELNEHYMTNYSTNQRRNVATHELGHALGLDHSYSGQVMYGSVSTVTDPQSHDIADYRELWG